MDLIGLDGLRLKDINRQHRDDDAIVLAAVKKYGRILRFASPRLQNDPTIVMAAVQNNWKAFDFAGGALQRDRTFLLRLIQIKADLLECVLPEFQNDWEFTWQAIQRNPSALCHALPQFLNDKAMVLYALHKIQPPSQVTLLFRKVSPRLKTDRQVVQTSLRRNGTALFGASSKFQVDIDLVLQSIDSVQEKDVVQHFERLPIQYQNDRKVVLAAVQRDGTVLRHVPKSSPLLEDRTVAVAALTSQGSSFQYLSPQLRADTGLALLAVQTWGDAWRYTSSEMQQTNRDLALAAVASDGVILRDMPQVWKMDRDIVLKAIQSKQPIQARQWRDVIPRPFHNDRVLILEFVKKDANFWSHIPTQFTRDEEIVMQAVKTSGNALSTVPMELMSDELVVEAISQDYCGDMLKYAPLKIRQDPKMMAVALSSAKHPKGVWHGYWHNLKQRLQALQTTLLDTCQGETILQELYSCDCREFSKLQEQWMSQKLEACWLVGLVQYQGDNDDEMIRLNQDARTIVFQFAGLSQAIGRFHELQQLAPVLYALRRSYEFTFEETLEYSWLFQNLNRT